MARAAASAMKEKPVKPEKMTGFCPTCHRTCSVISMEEAKSKLTGITAKSAKQKARRAQQEMRDLLVKRLGLDLEEVESVVMGTNGDDLKLGAMARSVWPFHAIEVTASPNVSIYAKYRQAEKHAEKQLAGKKPGNGKPVLVFKKNGTPLYAMLTLDNLVDLVCELQKLKFGKYPKCAE